MKNKKTLLLTLSIFALVGCGTGSNSNSNSNSSSSSVTSQSSSVSSQEVSSSSLSSNEESSESSSSSVEWKYNLRITKGDYAVFKSEHYAYAAGETVTLTCTLNEDCFVSYVRANNTYIYEVKDQPGIYQFTMPSEDVTIYFEAVQGYHVNIVANHANAALYRALDLYGAGYNVYLDVVDVEEGYYFDSFTIVDSENNNVRYYSDSDAKDRYYFYMPASSVTVTVNALEIPGDYSEIAGTYTGYQIDVPDSGAGFTFTINYDGSCQLKTDWDEPYFNGRITLEGSTITSTLKHLGNDYSFVANLSENKNILEACLSITERSKDYYILAKDGYTLSKTKTYQTLNDTISMKDKLHAFRTKDGTFFSFVNGPQTEIYYQIKAYEDGTDVEVSSFVADKIYQLKDSTGKEIHALKANGSVITLATEERGSFTCEGKDTMVLDGFGSCKVGSKQGTYEFFPGNSLLEVTIDGATTNYTLDLVAKTYVVNDAAISDPFVNNTYVGTFNTYDDDWSQLQFKITMVFSNVPGVISSFKMQGQDWGCSAIYSDQSYTNATYVYDDSTRVLTATGIGSKEVTFKALSDFSALTMTSNLGYISEANGTKLSKQ